MAYPNMAGPTAVLNVYGEGAGTFIPILSFTFEQQRGEPATMTVVVDNASGDFGPTCEIFDCTTFDTAFVPKRWFQMELSGGETAVTWRYPMMYQDQHQSVENASDATVTVSFVDFSEPLFTGDQLMDDVESTSASPKMAKAVIAEILEEFGVSNYDLSDYTDHPLAVLHRTGTPMEWLREVFDRNQGWWYFEDDTFILKDGGNWSHSDPATLELVGHEHLTLLNFKRELSGVINQATCQRVDASSGLALEKAGEGRGEQTFDLDYPCISASPRIWAPRAGEPPSNLKWYDASDNLIGTEATYTGSTPAAKFAFTLTPPLPDDGIFQVPFELYIKGQPENTNQTVVSNYSATYTATADQALNGPRILSAPITAPTVLNQADAEDYVSRVVLESILLYGQAQVEAILDATVQVGISVSLTVARARLTAMHFLLVGVSHAVDLDGDSPSALMTLDLCTYRQS